MRAADPEAAPVNAGDFLSVEVGLFLQLRRGGARIKEKVDLVVGKR
jgi:hypothetical protein